MPRTLSDTLAQDVLLKGQGRSGVHTILTRMQHHYSRHAGQLQVLGIIKRHTTEQHNPRSTTSEQVPYAMTEQLSLVHPVQMTLSPIKPLRKY